MVGVSLENSMPLSVSDGVRSSRTSKKPRPRKTRAGHPDSSHPIAPGPPAPNQFPFGLSPCITRLPFNFLSMTPPSKVRKCPGPAQNWQKYEVRRPVRPRNNHHDICFPENEEEAIYQRRPNVRRERLAEKYNAGCSPAQQEERHPDGGRNEKIYKVSTHGL